MNKLQLSIAVIAVVFATTEVHAQSESSAMASPWNVTSTSTSATHASAKMVGSSSSSSLISPIGGHSLLSAASAGGGGSSSALYLTPEGTFQHGMAPGSSASNGSLSVLGALASQSQFRNGTPGVGNSQLSAFNAQMMTINQNAGESSGLAALAHMATGSGKSANGMPGVQSPRMGFHASKACSSGAGAAQSCNSRAGK